MPRKCKQSHVENQSAIFIDLQLLAQGIKVHLHHRLAANPSRKFILDLAALEKNHLLVIVNRKREQDSLETPPLMHSVEENLADLGIAIAAALPITTAQNGETPHAHLLDHPVIQHFASQHTIDLNRSFAIHTSLQVELLMDAATESSGGLSNKSSVLTLFFHTFADAVQWILQNKEPWRNLQKALASGANAIKEGQLVAFPTETVYGLGADATNALAVGRIFIAKERPSNDPLIVHVCEREQLRKLVTVLPEKAEQLMQQFWPGPLTIVLPKSSEVPSIVTSGYSSVAVRMPSNPLAIELIRLSGRPIAAPSANRFGMTSPTTAQHVREQLEGRYDVLIDGGACTVGIESTVISFVGDVPKILRPGKVDRESIEACIGPVESERQADLADERRNSPGLLENHYAPRTPMYIVEDMNGFASRTDVGFLLFSDEDNQNFQGPVEYVSRSANMQEVAIRLYHAMRKLDELRLSMLVVKLLPEIGIGVAINNRLRKAARKTPLNSTQNHSENE